MFTIALRSNTGVLGYIRKNGRMPYWSNGEEKRVFETQRRAQNWIDRNRKGFDEHGMEMAIEPLTDKGFPDKQIFKGKEVMDLNKVVLGDDLEPIPQKTRTASFRKASSDDLWMATQDLLAQLVENPKWKAFLEAWNIQLWDFTEWSIDPATGIAKTEGDWDYAGRWSDYSVDAAMEVAGEDEDAEAYEQDHDAMGETWVNGQFSKALTEISAEVGIEVSFNLSDGTVDFEFKPPTLPTIGDHDGKMPPGN